MKYLLLLSAFLWANPLEKAQFEFLNQNWLKSNTALDSTKTTPKTLYLRALNFLQLKEYQASQNIIDSLLIQIEPEEALFYKSLLLRAYVSYKEGSFDLAQKRFESAKIYETIVEEPRTLWICKQIYSQVDLKIKVDECQNTLINKYKNSPETQVKSKTDNKESKTDSTLSLSQSGFFLQLGAFSSKINADKLAKKFQGLGNKVFVDSRAIGDKKLYLVKIIDFKSKDNANSFAEQHLKQQDYRIYSN